MGRRGSSAGRLGRRQGFYKYRLCLQVVGRGWTSVGCCGQLWAVDSLSEVSTVCQRYRQSVRDVGGLSETLAICQRNVLLSIMCEGLPSRIILEDGSSLYDVYFSHDI